MNKILKNIIKLDKQNHIEDIVTPLTTYLICNHFVSTEIHKDKGKYIEYDLNITANDLLKNRNFDTIKNNDILQVQVDCFDFFINNVLPFIKNMGIKIILITSQWHLPQINKDTNTDICLNDENILLWISQNPIYTNNKKYMSFPYGIFHGDLEKYMTFLKKYENNKPIKDIKILNQCARVHGHLPSNHIRKQYDIFGVNSGKPMEYSKYLENISRSEFVISTAGDRDDCYRH